MDKKIPKDVKNVTKALGEEYPPTNPAVVLDTAKWWYLNGKGASDPIFRQAVAWVAESEDIDISDIERYHRFKKKLDEVI